MKRASQQHTPEWIAKRPLHRVTPVIGSVSSPSKNAQLQGRVWFLQEKLIQCSLKGKTPRLVRRNAFGQNRSRPARARHHYSNTSSHRPFAGLESGIYREAIPQVTEFCCLDIDAENGCMKELVPSCACTKLIASSDDLLVFGLYR